MKYKIIVRQEEIQERQSLQQWRHGKCRSKLWQGRHDRIK
jgi:hypothetical protein